ncbi:hypothetical protein BX666DRAFT_1892276 [Dichotomocladium elegans]|nr:hypothetical protein BX666DRAFT_1892276 [Dichotomocladium elegans]
MRLTITTKLVEEHGEHWRMNGIESFEEKRENLLKDPSFHLIKVVLTTWIPAEIESLTIVTPALDPAIAEDVSNKGWNCLSHLWGPPEGWIVWDDAGVISADTGKVVTAKVNPGKRAEITELFLLHSSYWWVDVFCAQSNSPLVIMGDIYRFCEKCYALLGEPCQAFGYKLYTLYQHARIIEDELDEHVLKYLDHISTKKHSKSESIHRWWNNLKKNPHDMKLFRHYSKCSDEVLDDELFEHAPESPEYITITEIKRARDKERWDAFGLAEYTEAIPAILGSQWMTRVWTFQESALSPSVLVRTLKGENDDDFDSGETSSFEVARKTLIIWLKVATLAYRRQREIARNSSDWSKEKEHMTPRQLIEFYDEVDPILARVYRDYRKLLEAVLTFGLSMESEIQIGTSRVQKLYLNVFATCTRRATYSIDTIYGVLGIMDIDIPTSKDGPAVWRMFSEKLRENHPELHVPQEVDLIKARNMSDVFGKIGFIGEDFILDLDTIDQFTTEPVMDSD